MSAADPDRIAAELGRVAGLLGEAQAALADLHARLVPIVTPPAPSPIDDEIHRVRSQCRADGIAVGRDDTVPRKQAAHLLNLEPDTLRKRVDIRPVKGGHRKRYSLRAIAAARLNSG